MYLGISIVSSQSVPLGRCNDRHVLRNCSDCQRKHFRNGVLRVSATGANLPQTANGYAIANTSVLEYPNSDTTSFAVGPGALNAQSSTNLYNTAVGVNAMAQVSTAYNNTAVGWYALYTTATGTGGNSRWHGSPLL